MNKSYARKIAEIATNEQLLLMFKSAKEGVKDWGKSSSVNKSMTKGAAWNILAKGFDVTHNYHILTKTNMIREFGEFLPEELKIKKQTTIYSQNTVHQEPDFSGY